ncbi:MAG: tetratricopeptide repeat protein [Candidatus Methylomirabilales bacterium]
MRNADREAIPSRASPLFVLLLGLLAGTLYLNGLGNGFLIDDLDIVTTVTQEGRATPLSIFTSGEQIRTLPLPYYRPLTNLSYLLDRRLWGEKALGFHLTNLLLHLLTTLLVFRVGLKIAGLPLAAWGGALLFAAHPIHTESVSMVQGRTDLLATLFYVGAFLLFHRYRMQGEGPRALRLYGLSLASFFLALLSKEMAITLPLVIALHGFTHPPRPARNLWPLLWTLPYLGVLALYLGLRLSLLGIQQPLPDWALLAFPSPSTLVLRLLQVPILLVTYLRLLLWPYPLRFYRIVSTPEGPTDPAFLLPFLLVLLLLGGTALFWRRWGREAFWIGWIFLTLLPVLGLIPIPAYVMAERYLYLPSVGYTMLWALLLERLLRGPHPGRPLIITGAGLTLLLIAFAFLTVKRNTEWGDQLRIYQAMAQEAPDNSAIQNNLGVEYLRRERLEEAILRFQRAMALNPQNVSAYYNLGLAYARRGEMEAAEKAYRRALRLDPSHLKARWNLAALLEKAGRWRAAEREYLLGLKHHQRSRDFWRRFQEFYERTGQLDQARRLEKVLRTLETPAEGAP